MPDYSKSKIYILRSSQTDKVYVGSTIQSLKERLRQHKKSLKRGSCITSSKIVCYDDVEIVLLEDYPCNSKAELSKKEGEYIRELNCVNIRVAGRTKEQYRIDNKEQTAKTVKMYYEKHKDKILKYAKEYRNENKEKIAEYQRTYKEKNKEKLQQKQKQEIFCYACKCNVRKYRLKRHQRTKKHINNSL